MQQCSIYDNSLRFSRTIYGLLALLAFLFKCPWVVLFTGILMLIGAVLSEYNIFYQLHYWVLRKLLKDKSEPIKKEAGELIFACGMGGIFLIVGFLLLYFEKAVGFAWVLILLTSGMMLSAGIAGICMAAIMYAVFKKVIKKQQ